MKMTARVAAFGLLAAVALSGSLPRNAGAESRFAPEQKPVAEKALAKAQAARDAVKDDMEKSGETPTPRKERILAKADLELSRAARLYESGRYETAARSADRAAWLIASASLVRDDTRTLEGR